VSFRRHRGRPRSRSCEPAARCCRSLPVTAAASAQGVHPCPRSCAARSACPADGRVAIVQGGLQPQPRHQRDAWMQARPVRQRGSAISGSIVRATVPSSQVGADGQDGDEDALVRCGRSRLVQAMRALHPHTPMVMVRVIRPHRTRPSRRRRTVPRSSALPMPTDRPGRRAWTVPRRPAGGGALRAGGPTSARWGWPLLWDRHAAAG
jgi:hypothetical protein